MGQARGVYTFFAHLKWTLRGRLRSIFPDEKDCFSFERFPIVCLNRLFPDLCTRKTFFYPTKQYAIKLNSDFNIDSPSVIECNGVGFP